jgi:uncharacterized protein (TIGR00369 family)
MTADTTSPDRDSALSLDNPLLEHLGIRLVDTAPGRCEFRLDVEPRHLNRSASLHGGVVATLLDAACGYAGLHAEDGEAPPAQAVTVMLAISYLGRVDAGRIRALGRVTGGGRKVYFSSAELIAEDGRLIATAQGSFKRFSAAGRGAAAALAAGPDARRRENDRA